MIIQIMIVDATGTESSLEAPYIIIPPDDGNREGNGKAPDVGNRDVGNLPSSERYYLGSY